VVFGSAAVEPTQLRGDREDALAAHELREVEPVRADVRDRSRRKREAESLGTRAIQVNRSYLKSDFKELSTLSSQPSTDSLIRWHLHTGVHFG